jgi:hypothetical protein
MAGWWISLPARWELQDVQAAINVIITVLSTLGVFVFVRFCWRRAAKRITRDEDVPLPALLSLNTLGEALDVAFLLKEKLLTSRYISILAQCVIVVCLSSTALLAGIVTRYSSRRGEIISQLDVAGSLVTRQHNGMGNANVEWNLTYDRLNQAEFPNDQLLDFLPDNLVDWTYDASQWNNTWSFECEQSPQRTLKMHASGNCTKMSSELPELELITDYDTWDGSWHSHGGFYNNGDNWKDILMFIYSWKGWNHEEACDTNRAMTISLKSLHMHNVPKQQNETSSCNFGEGNISEAGYTAIRCELRRQQTVPDPCHVAFPDVFDNAAVPYAYSDYYQARFTQESTSDSPISVITPAQLIRFYQVYTVVKDLQYRQPVARQLSVNIRVVQLSIVSLTIVLFIALLIILGLLQYMLFVARHRDIIQNTPQSKLDWMLQSIQTEDRPLNDNKGRLRRSVTVDEGLGISGLPSVRRKRREFENAKFGGKAVSTWFLRDSPGMSVSQVSPRVDERISVTPKTGYFGYESPMGVQGERRPML